MHRELTLYKIVNTALYSIDIICIPFPIRSGISLIKEYYLKALNPIISLKTHAFYIGSFDHKNVIVMHGWNIN